MSDATPKTLTPSDIAARDAAVRTEALAAAENAINLATAAQQIALGADGNAGDAQSTANAAVTAAAAAQASANAGLARIVNNATGLKRVGGYAAGDAGVAAIWTLTEGSWGAANSINYITDRTGKYTISPWYKNGGAPIVHPANLPFNADPASPFPNSYFINATFNDHWLQVDKVGGGTFASAVGSPWSACVEYEVDPTNPTAGCKLINLAFTGGGSVYLEIRPVGFVFGGLPEVLFNVSNGGTTFSPTLQITLDTPIWFTVSCDKDGFYTLYCRGARIFQTYAPVVMAGVATSPMTLVNPTSGGGSRCRVKSILLLDKAVNDEEALAIAENRRYVATKVPSKWTDVGSVNSDPAGTVAQETSAAYVAGRFWRFFNSLTVTYYTYSDDNGATWSAPQDVGRYFYHGRITWDPINGVWVGLNGVFATGFMLYTSAGGTGGPWAWAGGTNVSNQPGWADTTTGNGRLWYDAHANTWWGLFEWRSLENGAWQFEIRWKRGNVRPSSAGADGNWDGRVHALSVCDQQFKIDARANPVRVAGGPQLDLINGRYVVLYHTAVSDGNVPNYVAWAVCDDPTVDNWTRMGPLGYDGDRNVFAPLYIDQPSADACVIEVNGTVWYFYESYANNGATRSQIFAKTFVGTRDQLFAEMLDPKGLGVSGAISSSGTITAAGGLRGIGSLTLGALATPLVIVSGTAFRVSTSRDTSLAVPVTYNPTGAAAATLKVEISPDGVTYSTLATKTLPAVASLAGTVELTTLMVPANWLVKLTATNATIGGGSYY